MITVALILLGLCLGSFANALIWRIHEQDSEATKKKPSKKRQQALSIAKGRSMCPHCGHELATKDLVPVLSWLSLGGKCRYCHKPISSQYPIVELITAALFVVSYWAWPVEIAGLEVAYFSLWLLTLVGLIALTVYDLRWMLLPNRIVYPLMAAALVMAGLRLTASDELLQSLIDLILSVTVGGGLFYLLFQVSQGKWIGGGDVRLGALLGLLMLSPGLSLLFIFIAAIGGSLISLPLLLTKRLKASSVIPFGPLLIAGGIVAFLWGNSILDWYQTTFLLID